MGRVPGSGFWAGLVARVRSLVRGLRRRTQIEHDMREEFRAHILMRAEDLVTREGLGWDEAMRRAHREFGHVETHRDAARKARGLNVFDQMRFSWLDVRLGLRMMVKHPWLTIVAAFALAVGIPIGLMPAHMNDLIEAPIPEDPENRIRALRFWDPVTTGGARPLHADLELWSAELSSFSMLGAFRTGELQVAAEDDRAAPVPMAHVTASTFSLLGRPPFMGRTLVREDEDLGAQQVAVLGHDLWVGRFGSDPAILGRTIRVGSEPHTVVGVMPEGFHFPASQQLWLPLRVEEGARTVATVGVFGRLADGVSAEEAQLELSVVGRSDEGPVSERRARLRPEVVPFGLGFVSMPRDGLDGEPGFFFVQILAWVLLLVACGNVAMLVFARTATRFRELAVRTALGASRVRIVSQIFVETLVLAVLAAGLGLVAMEFVLESMNFSAVAGGTEVPYWVDFGVTGPAFWRSLVLAVVSATVAGVVPALRITGTGVQENLKRAEAGNSGIHFGRVTGALIVADVAVSVAVVALAFAVGEQVGRSSVDQLVGIPSDEYLAVSVWLPGGSAVLGAGRTPEELTEDVAAIQLELVEQLQGEPGVRSVAVTEALPRMRHPSRIIEIEKTLGTDGAGPRHVRSARIDAGYLDALGQATLIGRAFTPGDAEVGGVVIVNEVFVERYLGGGDALGERVRFIRDGEPSEWQQIVGVVGPLGVNIAAVDGGPGLYMPAAPGTIHPLTVGIHVAGATEQLAPRVRAIVAGIDPDAIVEPPVALSTLYQGDWYITVWLLVGLGVLVGVLVIMAASGIYAIVSYSVTQRTREIGIRSALGAADRSLVLTILRRTLLQLAWGAALGIPLAWRLSYEAGAPGVEDSTVMSLLVAIGVAATIVVTVGLLSCLVPVRRILSVDPSEALRAEG